MDLFEQIQKLTAELDISIKMLRKNGEAYAEAEHDYKIELAKEALKLRQEEGIPVTMLNLVIYGKKNVAEKRLLVRRRCLAIRRIASLWNMSVIAHAAFVLYPSIAWVRASMPVAAVSFFGMVDIMSGSTTATSGMSLTSTQTNLRFFLTSVIT